jgi:hypothetical protein
MNAMPRFRRSSLAFALSVVLAGLGACSDDTEVTGSTLATADGTALGDAQGAGDAADDQQGQDVEAPDAATVTDIGPAPDGAEPDSASDASVDPDAVDPDAVGVDTTDLDVAGPDSDQPDATQPDATQPDTAIPDAGLPDTTQPDIAQPDTTQPDATQPDATQPDTAAPDVAFDAGPPGPVCAGAADCPATNNPCVQAICAAGKCSTAPKADGTVCAASSDPCKSDGVCAVGSCGAQIAKSCDDGNACTTDSCLPGKGCAWSPTTAACDDGNPCTAGEVCGVVAGKGVVCQGGKPVDGAAACDDKNPCTTDSCDVAKGCIHAGKVGTPCDDGSACTSGETCQASGACQPAGGPACDDGNPCTKDSCDVATKLCNFVPQNGVTCDDGQLCTSGDACGNGKCAGKPIACNDNNPCTGDVCDPATGKCAVLANTNGLLCDDGSACTAKDACLAGKCQGSPLNCSDGNDCTDDLCDTKTGACTFLANTAPCTGAVACLTGGQCKDGKCQAGTKPNCDDGSPCTADACDNATGKCVYTKAADGTVCDDGVACSSASACQSGACVPSAPCLVLANNSFDCGKASGWSFDPPLSTQDGGQVVWSVDNNPGVDGMTNNGGCALNYNDGDNYCAKAGNGCIGTHGKATSPNLDFTKTGGLTPLVTMDTYYEVDFFNTANPPKVLVIDVASGKELGVVSLPFGQGDINKVKTGLQLALPMAQGKIVKLQLVLGAPVGDGGVIYDGGNQGNGWYVDNLKVEAAYKPEICGDGIDNNANGKADCADPACAGQASCTESQCTDKLDNDGDAAIDCKDSDCAKNAACVETACGDGQDNDGDGATDCGDVDCGTALVCSATAKVLAQDPLVCGGSTAAWTLSSNSTSVVWALDQTPATPAGCALNYNNGKDYTSGNNAVAGSAQWTAALDTAGLSAAAVQFKLWLDVENEANSGSFDSLYVQVSADNWANCCQANQSCGNNNCSNGNNATLQVPRLPLKTWRDITLDVPKGLLGKPLKVRLKFDSGDGQFNAFAGPFVSSFKVIGQ